MSAHTHRRHLVILIVATLLTISCAALVPPPGLPRVHTVKLDGWQELRSPDFVLYARDSKENLEARATDLARYVAVVEELTGSQPPKLPAAIIFVDGRVEELFFRDEFIDGYGVPWLGGFSAFLRSSPRAPGNKHLLFHEFSHYLWSQQREVYFPSWYEEGFAEFLAPTRIRGDTMEIGSTPPNMWMRLEDVTRKLTSQERRRKKRTRIDLEEIFSFEKVGDWRYPDDFYSITWATIHYLRSDPVRQERLMSMLEFQNAGHSWNRAYAKAFPEPIEDLAARVKQHAKSLRTGSPTGALNLPLESLTIRNAWQIRSIPEIEVLQLLGTLTLRNINWLWRAKTKRIAEAFFLEALILDPENSLAHAGLAASLAAQEKFPQSSTSIRAFELDPSPSIDAIIYAGNAVQLEALAETRSASNQTRIHLHESATQLFQRALEKDPSNALAFLGLGISQFELDQLDAARTSLSQAQTIGEWDATLALYQGRVEMKAGAKILARAFWDDVVRFGHEFVRWQASDLIEELDAKD